MRFWKNIVSAIVLGTMLAACTAEDGARLNAPTERTKKQGLGR